MLIKVRDKKNNLLIKDVLDIDYDMSIENCNGIYYIWINSQYKYAEEYKTLRQAEDAMLHIAENRNALEEELRNY